MNYPDTPSERLQTSQRIVSRPIIHYDHLGRVMSLAEGALYGGNDELPIVVGRDDDRHRWPAEILTGRNKLVTVGHLDVQQSLTRHARAEAAF
jgi:hypothetical protein